jgi:hypothetical protein
MFMPKGGLEPPRVTSHAPQTCASTSSATSAYSIQREYLVTSSAPAVAQQVLLVGLASVLLLVILEPVEKPEVMQQVLV